MAINQINEYGASNTDIVNLQETTDDQRIGFHQGSLTEWDTATVPKIAGGTKFENNGSLWEVTTDTTLTGSPSSGKVYIYFNSDTPAFVMTNTAPTWSATKQGWYGTGGNANYRYLPFIMDLTAGLYVYKRIITVNNQNNRISLENWDDGDTSLVFAANSSIDYDDSADNFVINKSIDIGGNGTALSEKVVQIGDWNMDTTSQVSVPHGLTISNIRNISVFIIKDGAAEINNLASGFTSSYSDVEGTFYVNTSNVVLARRTGGYFDSTSYDSTSFNRGWIFIKYIT